MLEHQGHSAGAVGRGRRLRSAMRPSEQRLWKALRKLDAHIRRQAPIGPYIADFACHARKLVIEVDGEIHERLDDVALRDFERSKWLRGQGPRVLRFTNRQVDTDVMAVVQEIELHLALPLDGEGLGWGETATTGPDAVGRRRQRRSLPNRIARTPIPDPFPIEGKGGGGPPRGVSVAAFAEG